MITQRKASWRQAISLLPLCLAATAVAAAPIRFIYEDVIDFSNVVGVSGGDPVSVVLTLDNGSSSHQSQVWTATNLISVAFSFGSGALSTTFLAPFGDGVLTNVFGVFATDFSGLLTAVPSRWSDFDVGSNLVTTLVDAPEAWNLNSTLEGAPEVYFTSSAELTFVNRTLIGSADAWNIAPHTISAPTSLWLTVLGGAGIFLSRCFRGQGPRR